jgi:hypothetical protein
MGEGKFIICEKCARHYAWQEAMAGKKMRCKCGHVFVPRVREEVEDPPDEYGLAPEEAVAPVARTVAAAGLPVLQYAHKAPVRQEQKELERSSHFKRLYLPIALIVAGVGLHLGQIWLPRASGQSAWIMAGVILAAIVVNVILMLCGALVASHVLGADFGPMQQAVVKLTAISIIGGAAASFVATLPHAGIAGPIAAVHVLLLIYFVLFSMLFELDLQESLFSVVIVMFFQMAAFCVALGRLT